ncbi:MAG: HD domain-containing protein, partial [Oscillochloris sp.]|nr:HD domain-containing protein [Oscillochloris sp.]
MIPATIDHFIQNLAGFCATRGIHAWLVGGAARDIARGVTPADIDLAIDGDGLKLARDLAADLGGSFVPLDDQRDTVRVVFPSRADTSTLTVDIARLRASSIEEDLGLRDFTINALAFPLSNPSLMIDPTGGLADLRACVLRACGPTSMADDPLRTLRAARFGATLDLQADPELARHIRAAAPRLAHVAAERIRDELLKLLDTPNSTPWLRYMDTCGVLTTVLPELEPARTCTQPRVHFLPVLEHMLETVASLEWVLRGFAHEPPTNEDQGVLPIAVRHNPGLPRQLPYAERYAALMREIRGEGRQRVALLKLATLIHDNAKPQTKQISPDGKVSFHGHQELGADVAEVIGKRLRLSRSDGAYVTLVVREHMRPGQLRTGEVITKRAVVRFFRDMGNASPDV